MASEFTPDTIKLQGKDYLEVAQRVLWLRTEHPDAQIVTDLITHNEETGYALFKAVINIPTTNGTATGWGAANRKDLRGPVAANYVEKAETKAIGRACAGLGYGTLAAMHEDGDTLADAPVERKATAAPPAAPDPRIVAAVENWRRALAEKGIVDEAEQNAWAKQRANGRKLSTLAVADWDVLMATARALPNPTSGPTRRVSLPTASDTAFDEATR